MNPENSSPGRIPVFEPPALDRKILRYLQVEELPDQLGRVEELWNEALSMLTPAAAWTLLPYDRFMAKLPDTARRSAALNRWLEGCDRVALLATTIGEGLELRARYLFANRETFGGYMLDRMGSYLADLWMAQLDRHVQVLLESDRCRCSRRYSPGYADTPLAMQDVFLEFAQGGIPFLRLSDAHMLKPEKSVFALKAVYGCLQG